MATKKTENQTITNKTLARELYALRDTLLGFGEDSDRMTAHNPQEVMKNMQEYTNRILFTLNKISALVAEPKVIDAHPTPVQIDKWIFVKISLMTSAVTAGLVAAIMGLLG